MSAENEPLYSANRLASLAQADRRTIDRKLAGIEPTKRQGKTRLFRLADVLPALCVQPRNADTEQRILSAREREQVARADVAEMDRDFKRENLIPVEWWIQALEAFGLEVKAEVLASDLPLKGKQAVCAKLAMLKPSQIFTAHKGEPMPVEDCD